MAMVCDNGPFVCVCVCVCVEEAWENSLRTWIVTDVDNTLIVYLFGDNLNRLILETVTGGAGEGGRRAVLEDGSPGGPRHAGNESCS